MATELPEIPAPSMAALVGGIFNDAQVLIKQELALVRRTVLDEVNKAMQAATCMGIGFTIGAVGGLLLALMLVNLLYWASAERLPLWACYGVVGTALVLVGGGLFYWARRRAGEVHLMPEETLVALKDNVAWIKTLS
jgi:protein-S-isoprenylcysteine O-methyltransferase Ste14